MVKIFSNFDTKAPAKHYAEAVQQYSFDKVIFIRRHKIYFRTYVIIPMVIGLFFLGVGIFFLTTTIKETDTGNRIFSYILGGLSSITSITILIYTLNRYFNYTLDYSIITPEYIASYDQKGFFKRQITTIEIEKIKTINFYSGGFFNSLFNFGRIDILLEGDNEGRGDISVDFVKDPEGIKYNILKMMGIHYPEEEAPITKVDITTNTTTENKKE